MRIIYGIISVAVCVALVIGIQQWRGPLLPALMVTKLPLELRIVASGEVRYQSLAKIGSEITGTVKARYVREGDWVNEGDLLVELNPQELQAQLAQTQTLLQQLQQKTRPQSQAALIEARDILDQASREARRREKLSEQGVIPIEQVEQAQRFELSAKAAFTRTQIATDALAENSTEERLLKQRIASAELALAKTRLYAPFKGRIQTRNVESGDLVQPGKVLLEIARNDSQTCQGMTTNGMEVVIALDEKNFAPVKLGQPVKLIADAWPNINVAGEVGFIAPAVDTGRGTIDVHINVLRDEQTPDFLQGMTVSANIIADERASTLVLPNDYVFNNRADTAQVLLWQDDKVTPVDVTLGLRNVGHSEIVSGLNEGDIVVQAGSLTAEKTKSSQRVRVYFEQIQHVIR